VGSEPSRDELAELLPVRPVAASWLSGSRVEGLAHASSDVDVYCAVESLREDFAWTRRDPWCAISVSIEGGRRMDFEYWTLEELDRIASKLGTIPFDDPERNLLDHLSPIETEVIHRIKVGVPLTGEGFFAELRETFDFAAFRRYLVRNALYYVDDAFDDAVGLYLDGDLESAALRARATIGFSIDALLAAYDETNDKAKFRMKKLRSLVTRRPEVGRHLERYREAELRISLDANGQARYVEQSLALSSELVENAQEVLERGGEPTAVDLESRPARRFSVRKRRSGGETFLIQLTQVHAVDRFGEAVWDLADGGRTVVEMLSALADRFPELEKIQTLERAVRTLSYFRDHDLLAFPADGRRTP
jgi:hypothetical protein